MSDKVFVPLFFLGLFALPSVMAVVCYRAGEYGGAVVCGFGAAAIVLVAISVWLEPTPDRNAKR